MPGSAQGNAGSGGIRRARVLVATLEGSAHVTLAHIRQPANIEPLVEKAELALGSAHFDELVLYRSELRREGSLYTPLGAWPLSLPAEAAP